MSNKIEIDEIDIKILNILLIDARTKATDLSKKCNMSSTSIIKRINRLKKLGIIVSSTLLVNMNQIGHMFAGSIEIESVKEERVQELLELMNKRSVILVNSYATGKSNFAIFFVAKQMIEIESLRAVVKNYSRTGKVSISYWNTPIFNLKNVEITI
jgi:Lrp/AsnC family transcriptional regulator, regulator for asnA, asnC and gidA